MADTSTRKVTERRRRRASEQSEPESEEEEGVQDSQSNRVVKVSECESEVGTVEDHDLSEYESATENGEEEIEYEVEVEYEEGDSVVIDSEYDEGEWVEEERQSGDGEEQPESKENLDDDEDKKNPAYVPRRGAFYEHDLRTGEEAKKEKEAEQKKLWKDEGLKWDHDKYHPDLQAPKSREEIIAQYGYDIRSRDKPPDAPARRPRTDPRNKKNRLQDYVRKPSPGYSQDVRNYDHQPERKSPATNGETTNEISTSKEDFPPLSNNVSKPEGEYRENSPNQGYDRGYSSRGGRGRGGRGGGYRGRGGYSDLKNSYNRDNYNRNTRYNRDSGDYNERDSYRNNRNDNYEPREYRDNRNRDNPRGRGGSNRGFRDRPSGPRQFTNSNYQGARSDPIPRLQHLSARQVPPEKKHMIENSTKVDTEQQRGAQRVAGTGRVVVPQAERKSYQKERRGIGRTRVQSSEEPEADDNNKNMNIHETPPPEPSSPLDLSSHRGNSYPSYPHISPEEKPVSQPHISQLQNHRPLPERSSRSPNERRNYNKQQAPVARNDAQSRTKRYSSQRQRGVPEQTAYPEQSKPQQPHQQQQPPVMENRPAFFPTTPPGQPRPSFPRAPVFQEAPQLAAPPNAPRFATPSMIPQAVAPFTIPVSSSIASVGMPYNPPPSGVVAANTQNVIAAHPSAGPVYVPVSIVSYGMPPPAAAPHYKMAGQIPLPQVYPSTGPEGIHVRGGTTYFSPEVQALQGTTQRPQTKTRQKAAIPIVNPQDVAVKKQSAPGEPHDVPLLTQEQLEQGLYYDSGNKFRAPDGTVYSEFYPASMMKSGDVETEETDTPESLTPVNSPSIEEMSAKSNIEGAEAMMANVTLSEDTKQPESFSDSSKNLGSEQTHGDQSQNLGFEETPVDQTETKAAEEIVGNSQQSTEQIFTENNYETQAENAQSNLDTCTSPVETVDNVQPGTGESMLQNESETTQVEPSISNEGSNIGASSSNLVTTDEANREELKEEEQTDVDSSIGNTESAK